MQFSVIVYYYILSAFTTKLNHKYNSIEYLIGAIARSAVSVHQKMRGPGGGGGVWVWGMAKAWSLTKVHSLTTAAACMNQQSEKGENFESTGNERVSCS